MSMSRAEAIRDIEECVIPYDGCISLRMAVEDMKAMDRLSKIAYLCKEHGEGNTCPRDGSTCSYDVCKHTTDVKYAKNFVQVSDDSYMEIDDDQKRWIPCTESKPEPYRDVIFCDVDGDIYKGSMYNSGNWYDDAYDDPVKNVVAWMPLPESYKGGVQNE